MSDQVTHTPTPWVMGAGFDGLLTINAKVSGRNLRVLELCGNLKNPEVVANAEFIILAVNAHDALTARVAELEAENERLMDALKPFAEAASAFSFAVAPDGIDNGYTITAFVNCRPEREADLATTDFSRALSVYKLKETR